MHAMSSRSAILAAIRDNKPGPRPLPDLPADPPERDLFVLEAAFRSVLEAGKATFISWEALLELSGSPAFATVASRVPGIEGNLEVDAEGDPLGLAGVDLAILSAPIGVAENGAMWVSEREAGHRILPFITQHLVLVVSRSNLVATMHEAYRRTAVDDTGFGVFIAGPSKTADIEQSLVIGAHGARSLRVCLTE